MATMAERNGPARVCRREPSPLVLTLFSAVMWAIRNAPACAALIRKNKSENVMSAPRTRDQQFVFDCLVGAAGGGVAGILAMLTVTVIGPSPGIDARGDQVLALCSLFFLHSGAAMLGALLGGFATAWLNAGTEE